jgi:hypothetical protein
MVAAISTLYDLPELRRKQVEARCLISTLYGELLLAQPVLDSHLINAAHDWSLSAIANLTQDLLVRIPCGLEPRNFYSKYFSEPTKDTRALLTKLSAALNEHELASTRIEQHGKGVL